MSLRRVFPRLGHRSRRGPAWFVWLLCLLALLVIPLAQVMPVRADDAIVLTVPTIAQRFSPAERSGTGWDSGAYDCVPTSVAMALQGLQVEGILGTGPGITADYGSVRHAFRALAPNPYGGIDPTLAVNVVPALTNNQIDAAIFIASGSLLTSPANGAPSWSGWEDWVRQQLSQRHPFVAIINDASKLKGGYIFAGAHAITVYGLQDGQVIYNDPWDGQRYSMTADAFAAAWGNDRLHSGTQSVGWAAVTFAPHAAAPTPTPPPTPTPTPSPRPTVGLAPTIVPTTGPSPTPVPIRPGGLWIGPPNGASFSASIIPFAAHAYPAHSGDPAIDHVAFTLWWPALGPKSGPWKSGCTAPAPAEGDVFACNASLLTLGAPAGTIWVSFDVYDQAGNRNLSPNGEHTIQYQPPAQQAAPTPAQQASVPTPVPTSMPVPPAPTPTAAPTPVPTPPPANPDTSFGSFSDDFSEDTPGQPPAGYALRGASQVTPTVENIDDGGSESSVLSFPDVPSQYWDRWVLKDGLVVTPPYSVTVKINVQESVADRAGLTIAWNDATQDHIDIQTNIYFKDIEFRVTYSGGNPSNVQVTGPATAHGGLPITAGTDYWMRVDAESAGPGQGVVTVFWSSDGGTFTPVLTATGLADLSGMVGMSTAGPHLPHVYFSDFEVDYPQ